MVLKFGEAERYIKELFTIGERVNYQGQLYEIDLVGKPVISFGEPKTDIYIRLVNNYERKEIKISVKKQNADFLENKTSAERAEQILGENWENIIIQSTKSIEQMFLRKPLIYKVNKNKTEAGAITLGWKFELLNKSGGELSGELILNKNQLIDIYAGTNLDDSKKNASVSGITIINSGIANYILMGDLENYKSSQAVIDNLLTVEEYVEKYPKIYFACKALNYRTFADKYDGNRPLAVYVDWNVINGKLTPEIIFNNPLETKGNSIAKKLLESLKKLNVNTTDELNDYNLSSMSFVAE